MNFPAELRYTSSHEWAKKDGNIVRVGITEYAQKEISDVVFVELPKVHQKTEQGKAAAVVESVKAAFDIYAPVSGKVVRVDQVLESDPAIINKDPYGEGWFFEIEMDQSSEWDALMTADDYTKMLKQSVK